MMDMEIGTFDVGSSRRGRTAAGGSQNSGGNSTYAAGPVNNTRPMTGGSNRFTGAGSNYGGGGDILDEGMSRAGDGMYRDRSKNLLSDTGIRFGDDDVMSHYLGQSEYGGASVVNGGGLGQEHSHMNMGSHDAAQPPKSGGSRRQQVLAR